MKRYVLVAVAILAAACGSSSPSSPSQATQVVFTAALSPANEVPPITNADQSGSGSGTFRMDLTRDGSGAITAAKATFVFSLSSFPANSQLILTHIHTGAAGINGSPIVNSGLSAATAVAMPNGSLVNQTFSNIDVTPTNAQLIIDNPSGYYFNVHTTLSPGGAARAQLVRQ
ncbi:MAG TPA: CHRD domain-containing protein [Vicinamibacterales bacterium]|nr:CHRD domain-containing protein [Vicinamibacterales bacterium]